MKPGGNAECAKLLSELHHRFKNNLQLLASLCGLQADRATNPAVLNALSHMQNRVRAIAHIHERLHQVGGESYIDAGEYLSNLIRELGSSYSANQRLRLELSFIDMALDTEHALSLGLLSNELLSNAFEHAFPGNRQGTISAALRYAANGNSETGELEIKDDGVGLPREIDFWRDDSLGFHLVRILATQLGADVHVESNVGTLFRIRFPLVE